MYIRHSNNIVHGDIKPSNIYVHGDGTICIGDFGCARFIT